MDPLTAREVVARAELRDLEEEIEAVSDEVICVGCGCSNRQACHPACSWIVWWDIRGICSICVLLPIDELVRRQQNRIVIARVSA
jgi:hypothetical protein